MLDLIAGTTCLYSFVIVIANGCRVLYISHFPSVLSKNNLYDGVGNHFDGALRGPSRRIAPKLCSFLSMC